MLTQVTLLTLLVCVAGWMLPKLVMRLIPMPAGAVAILCTMLLFGAATLLMLLMDATGAPMRFADPTQEGAFLFSTVALAIPGCIVLAARIAMLKGTGT
ncbi:hypothetical protein [uncultured Tateyamaria sp.]|uniref:hypothetical protein n=1 Tax=uncultured Tateyamaria sp. TaxID=455651 RepID=UPI00263290C4|nr:hypothetical protein [uncultured Tateyamaria sp.]